MQYFDTRTGALVDDIDGKLAIENRLAQSYPIVPVSGTAADIVQAGRNALSLTENELGPLTHTDDDRPLARETAEEAQENLEREREEQAKVRGYEPPDPMHGRQGEVLEQAEARAEGADEPEGSNNPAAGTESQGAGDPVLARGDGEEAATPTGEKVEATSKKESTPGK
jgi:hypothetical protein